MIKYLALLISPNGDLTTNFEEDTIQKVEEDLMRSKLTHIGYFYPYNFIIKIRNEYEPIDTAKKKIIAVVTPPALNFMTGWTINKAIKKIVAENSKLKENDIIWGF